jgi:hypothetical protein
LSTYDDFANNWGNVFRTHDKLLDKCVLLYGILYYYVWYKILVTKKPHTSKDIIKIKNCLYYHYFPQYEDRENRETMKTVINDIFGLYKNSTDITNLMKAFISSDRLEKIINIIN